jgi:hypothetical protein
MSQKKELTKKDLLKIIGAITPEVIISGKTERDLEVVIPVKRKKNNWIIYYDDLPYDIKTVILSFFKPQDLLRIFGFYKPKNNKEIPTENSSIDYMKQFIFKQTLWKPNILWVDAIQLVTISKIPKIFDMNSKGLSGWIRQLLPYYLSNSSLELLENQRDVSKELIKRVEDIKNLRITSLDILQLESMSSKEFFNIINNSSIQNLELILNDSCNLDPWIHIKSLKKLELRFAIDDTIEPVVSNQFKPIESVVHESSPKEVEIMFNILNVSMSEMQHILSHLYTTESLIFTILDDGEYDDFVEDVEFNYILWIPKSIKKLVINYEINSTFRLHFLYFNGCESIETLIINNNTPPFIIDEISDYLGFCYFDYLPKLKLLKLKKIGKFPIGIKKLLNFKVKSETQTIDKIVLDNIILDDNHLIQPKNDIIKMHLKDELNNRKITRETHGMGSKILTNTINWEFGSLSNLFDYWKPKELELKHCIYSNSLVISKLVPEKWLRIEYNIGKDVLALNNKKTLNLLALYDLCTKKNVDFLYLDDNKVDWIDILTFLRFAKKQAI